MEIARDLYMEQTQLSASFFASFLFFIYKYRKIVKLKGKINIYTVSWLNYIS